MYMHSAVHCTGSRNVYWQDRKTEKRDDAGIAQ